MMKKKVIVFFIFILLFVSLSPQYRIPRSDCCFQIWAAGCNLGWSTSLMYYTQIRQRWSVYDRTTYDNIIRGGRHIEAAYRSCSSGPKAWPGWRSRKNQLNNIARSLRTRPDSRNRKQLYNRLRSTYNWATGLMWAVHASRLVRSSTCAEKYYRLGWLISNAQQTLKIADECYNQGRRSYFNWRVPFEDAKRSMRSARKVLYSYYRLRPVTGSCVYIRDLGVDNKLKELQRLNASKINLEYMIRRIDWIQGNLQRRLRDRCGVRRNSGNNRRPSVNVRNAHKNHFVGRFKLADPARSYKQYNGKVTFKSNGRFTSWESSSGKGKGVWSFNYRTKVFTIDWKPGGRFSGRVRGNTNNFVISGRWSNGKSGRLKIYR